MEQDQLYLVVGYTARAKTGGRNHYIGTIKQISRDRADEDICYLQEITLGKRKILRSTFKLEDRK